MALTYDLGGQPPDAFCSPAWRGRTTQTKWSQRPFLLTGEATSFVDLTENPGYWPADTLEGAGLCKPEEASPEGGREVRRQGGPRIYLFPTWSR